MKKEIEKIINSKIEKITTSYNDNGKNFDVSISFKMDDLNKIKLLYNLNEKDYKPVRFESKRNNRFLVNFPKEFNLESWAVQKINKPKFTDEKWEDIKIEFIDPIVPSTSQSLFEIINFLKTNKNDNEILFEIKIISLDPTGIEIEEWIIYVGKVLTINFGELSYSDNGIQQPYLILKPLKCILKY